MSKIYIHSSASRLALPVIILTFSVVLAACGMTEGVPGAEKNTGGPSNSDLAGDVPDVPVQSQGWNAEDLNCESSQDCMDHETCIDGVCHIDRCSAAEYQSLPPLGDSFLFYADLELAVTDQQDWSDEYWLDRYSPGASDVDYDGSWNLGTEPALDIAGGDFLGDDRESYAYVFEGVGEAYALVDTEPVTIPLPLLPRAIAAGDVDSDSVDELIVAGSNRFAVCDFGLGYCQPFDLDSGVSIIDVAVGDIDGDVLREVLFLVDTSSGLAIVGVNFDSNQTQQEQTWFVSVDDDAHKIAAGDLDGDGLAEIVTIEEGGWWNQNDDELNLYRLVEEGDTTEIQRVFHVGSGYNRLLDLDIGDINSDDELELILLEEDQGVKIAHLVGNDFDTEWTGELSITGKPGRIATADHDGNSPKAVLQQGPEVVPGASVPVVAMLLPPYSYEHSAGFSSTGYGMAETLSETYSDTVSMSIGMDVGVSGNFLGLFAAKFSEKVGYSASQTLGENTTRSTGNRSGMRSQPDDFGFNYGAVVVSWGCFHAYTYEVSDPNNHVPGSDGEPIVLTVPVDSGTAMLSTNRYNALAALVGNLPIIEAPYTLGDIYSYPTQPETIYGEPIRDDQYVFPGLDFYEVSDVGYVGWFNVAGQSTTNSASYGMDMGMSAGVTISGVSVGASTSSGWGKGYSLTLGETALFSGGIPPLRDNPDTDVDEYVENFYRVAPITYMQDYTDDDGNTAAFYVQTYAIDY